MPPTLVQQPRLHRPGSRCLVGRLRDRLWRHLVDYPAAGQPFRSTTRLGLAMQLRLLILAMVVCLGLLLVAVAAAVTPVTHDGPVAATLAAVSTYGVPVLVLAAGFGLTANPRGPLVGAWRRDRWARRHPDRVRAWEHAGCPPEQVAWMRRSPVDVVTFAAYFAALCPPGDRGRERGVDPRLVWALWERGVSPADAGAHRDLGVPLSMIPVLAEHGFTVARWTPLAAHGRIAQVFAFAWWLASGPGSLHPAQFPAQPPGSPVSPGSPARTGTSGAAPGGGVVDGDRLDAAVAAVDAWAAAGLDVGWTEPCPDTPSAGKKATGLPCTRCGGTRGHGRVIRSLDQEWPLARWVEVAGVLAPWFVAAGFTVEDAAAVLAEDPESVTVEALATLAALRD